MLLRENRLKKKKDFEKVFKQGKGFKQGFLFLKVMENDSQETRLGFIVSQKVSKKAVARNRVKRRLREIARGRLKEIKKGVDAVLVALPGLEEKEFVEIEESVNRLFKKAGILTENITI